MKMKAFKRDPKNSIRKASTAEIALNLAELCVLIPIVLALIARPGIWGLSDPIRIAAVLVCALMSIGSATSIYASRTWQHMVLEHDMLREALGQVETLNLRLRTQRHDFLNHMQVIYSFIEMGEAERAAQYIDMLNGQMQVHALSARTALPAVNALLQVKLPLCETHGIDADLRIEDDFAACPIEEWELCRILGNLIDNAVDALRESDAPSRVLKICFSRENALLVLVCANNGPQIHPDHLASIFNLGFTTKKEGRGLGLNIVKSIAEAAGGRALIETDEEFTAFRIELPVEGELS